MTAYIVRRLFLIIPTLLGIMLINFIIVQLAPGGPVEQMIAQIQGTDVGATDRFTGGEGGDAVQQPASNVGNSADTSRYRGAQGLDPEIIADIERMFGFDKPMHERFVDMIASYATFDFGDSFFKDQRVVDLVIDKMPVSISLGLWTTLIVYLISIPLGIAKANRDGSRFDVWTSGVVIIGYAIPSFLFAVLLIVLFAGGRFWDVFPLRGLVSDNWQRACPGGSQILDYLWHMTLPDHRHGDLRLRRHSPC